MTRSEALNLLQVLLLDERKVPPLEAPKVLGKFRSPGKKMIADEPRPVMPSLGETSPGAGSQKARLLL